MKAYFYSSIRMTLYFLSVCGVSLQNIIMESKVTGIIWHRFSIQLTVFHATLGTFSIWQIWRESYSLTHFLMGSGGSGKCSSLFCISGDMSKDFRVGETISLFTAFNQEHISFTQQGIILELVRHYHKVN